MHKYRIFTFMNLIYILYIAHNKVDLVAQLLPFKLEVKGSIRVTTSKPISKTSKERSVQDASCECNEIKISRQPKIFHDNLIH